MMYIKLQETTTMKFYHVLRFLRVFKFLISAHLEINYAYNKTVIERYLRISTKRSIIQFPDEKKFA